MNKSMVERGALDKVWKVSINARECTKELWVMSWTKQGTSKRSPRTRHGATKHNSGQRTAVGPRAKSALSNDL